MKAIIKSFGTKLNGRYGVTGTLISHFTEEEFKSQIENAEIRHKENPYHSITIIVDRCNVENVQAIKDNCKTSGSVCVREPASFEQKDLT